MCVEIISSFHSILVIQHSIVRHSLFNIQYSTFSFFFFLSSILHLPIFTTKIPPQNPSICPFCDMGNVQWTLSQPVLMLSGPFISFIDKGTLGQLVLMPYEPLRYTIPLFFSHALSITKPLI